MKVRMRSLKKNRFCQSINQYPCPSFNDYNYENGNYQGSLHHLVCLWFLALSRLMNKAVLNVASFIIFFSVIFNPTKEEGTK